MKNRIKKVPQIQTIIQEKVKHGGFQEENAEAKSETIRKKKPPLEKYDFGGVHGRPYKKK